MIKTVLVTAMAAAIGFGCHGLRRIDMKNETADSVQIIWTLEKDSLKGNPFLISNSEELKFTLYPPNKREVKMSFGSGNWSLKEVEKLTGYLKSLEIISPTKHIKLDSIPVLREYLFARRKGIGGARIEITVSE